MIAGIPFKDYLNPKLSVMLRNGFRIVLHGFQQRMPCLFLLVSEGRYILSGLRGISCFAANSRKCGYQSEPDMLAARSKASHRYMAYSANSPARE